MPISGCPSFILLACGYGSRSRRFAPSRDDGGANDASPPACRGARAAPHPLFFQRPPRGEAERRETRGLARPPGWLRATPARLRGVPPSLCDPGKARLSALHSGFFSGFFRSRATLSRRLRRLISQLLAGGS